MDNRTLVVVQACSHNMAGKSSTGVEMHQALVQNHPSVKSVHLDILRYLMDYIQRNGYQPSYREIAEEFKITKTAVVGRLKVLANANVITLPKNKERAIEIAHVTWQPVLMPLQVQSDKELTST